MATRICSYNIEWFDDLFNADNTVDDANAGNKKRLEAIRDVLKTVDPDLIGIVEAPNTTTTTGQRNTVEALENFAAWGQLRTTKAMTGTISAGRQELALLYDPAKVTTAHAPGGKKGVKKNPPFDEVYEFDTDEDRIKELYEFYRPPLEAKVQIAGGKELHLALVHPKSKGIFSSMDVLHWDRENLRNRRKIFAECSWIRLRVEEWLAAGHEVVVMGDMNDGPGMDSYEFQFARSAVEIVMGNLFEPGKVLRNLAGKPRWTDKGWKPSSARFKDRITETYVNVLIDHILISNGIQVAGANPHRIWNPYELDDAKPIKGELLTASDHFPVTLDLE